MSNSENKRPIIGITIGDVNGIGPEIIIKSLEDNRLLKYFTPLIYGSSRVLSYYRKSIESKNFNFNQISELSRIADRKINVLNCWNDQIEIKPGESTPQAGELAFKSLEMATNDLKEGKIHALVTAPINKENIQGEHFKFKGHTDYLTNTFEVKDSLMFMVSEFLKVGLVTDHVSIKDVTPAISKEKILIKLKIMEKSLKRDFGITKPKIAILGLNPHAGESGVIGTEDEAIILPAIKEAKEKGTLAYGPFAADGFFGNMKYKKYDAVLAMYHDQGLIPFKTIAFGEGVNFTAGLPQIRTSPDHGTAYDISGKNMADHNSMRRAIYAAADMIDLRSE